MTHVVVWVVDDDADVAAHLALVCEQAGFEAELYGFPTAARLQEALDAGAPTPDLVLVDQILPDGRGTDLRAVVQRGYPSAVVRLITAAPDEIDDIDRALGVVTKPPTVAVVQALLAHRGA